MRNARGIRLVFCAVLLVSSSAAADSDYHYCTSRGLLAFGAGRLEDSGHVLRVLRFSRDEGIVELEPVPLPDFQVHGIDCGEGRVEIEGWSVGYTVDLSTPTAPVVSERPTRRESTDNANLGRLAEPGVYDLESDGAPDEFQLVVARVERSRPGAIERHTTTRLIHRPGGAPHRVADSIELFYGISLETVD